MCFEQHPLVMTSTSPWKPWPIEIDALPMKNGWIFPWRTVINNQIVFLKTSGHPFLAEGNLISRANKQSDKALGTHDDLIDSVCPKKKNCTMSNYMISSSFTIIYSLAIFGLTYTSPTNRMPIFMISSLNSFAVSVIHSVPCKPVPRLQ